MVTPKETFVPELRPFLNKIHLGDSAIFLEKIPSESIDLVVTSPPYDMQRKYEGFTFDFCKIAKELSRVLKPGGVIVWVVADETVNGSETLTSFKQAIYFNQKCGLNVWDTMIWSKQFLKYPDAHRYYNTFEYMFIFSKGSPKSFNPIADRKNKYGGMTVHGFQREKNNEFRVRSGVGNKIKNIGIRWNVWEYHSTADRQYYADDIRDHPARFPEPLAKDHIISWSNEYDVVLDPFCGSGTTVKMAKAENRYYIGIEISPKYVEMGEKRISRVGIMNPCAHLGGNDEKAE